jgi:RND family efflux transporter MFP subunit
MMERAQKIMFIALMGKDTIDPAVAPDVYVVFRDIDLHDLVGHHLELLERAAAQGGTNPREVANATSEVAVTRAQVGQAEAAIGVLERQHELLAERLKDLAIVAPFSGTVTRRHTDLGAWVPEGGAVIDLVATDQLEAWFEVPQEHLGAALALAAASAKEPSRPVPIEIELAPGQPISAVAMRVVPEIDPRTRSFRAICRIEAGDRALAAGLALTAFVASGELAPRLVLPKDAVLRGDAGPYVFVVRGGVAMPAPVRIAFPLGDSVVVEPGAVRAGESVVTEGNERLMPMTPVAPMTSMTSMTAPTAAMPPEPAP